MYFKILGQHRNRYGLGRKDIGKLWKGLIILWFGVLGKIDCENIVMLIEYDSPICSYPIYTRDTLGRLLGQLGAELGEGLFVARVERGATTQPLHYSIYPVG